MKKIFYIIPLIICIILILLFINTRDNFITPSSDLISRQEHINEEIKKYIKDETYTIDNPKIINNPYEISPLTSLIIFRMQDKTKLSVFLNDELVTTLTEKQFLIPIVNLIENYNNKIDLVTAEKKYTYFIKTEKINHESIKSAGNYSKSILASGTKMKHFIMNSKGELIWYLDIDSQGLIEPLDDNTFLIGTEESEYLDNTSSFSGIYVIDYLGKIIKRIDTPYKYHHEILNIGANHVLVLGSLNRPMDLVYELDLKSGSVVKEIDIYELLSENESIKDYLNSLEYGIFTNSIDYQDGRLLLSLRNINTILELDYSNAKINYIISSDKVIQKNLSEYIIDTDELLLGEHNAKYVGKSSISFYNNGYDYTKKHSNTSASGIILNINNKVEIKEKYTFEEKYSYAFGSIHKDSDYTIVNYPYMYKSIPDNPVTYDAYYSNIVIYEGKKRVKTLKMNDTIYKAKPFAIKMLYNYKLKHYDYFNASIKNTNEKIKCHNVFEYDATITNNSIELMFDTKKRDTQVYFVGKKNYVIPYRNTKTYFKVNEGIYTIYIKMNDLCYKYPNKIKFF